MRAEIEARKSARAETSAPRRRERANAFGRRPLWNDPLFAQGRVLFIVKLSSGLKPSP
jgi:hypothetical protein